MADDMLSTPYVSVFDKTLKTRGRPSKYKTEEEKIQARRETAITFYYNNQDYIALQKKYIIKTIKKLYWNDNVEGEDYRKLKYHHK
jgi:hypothetical protein